MDITLTINGHAHVAAIHLRATLLDLLRDRIGLTGTKKGCDEDQFGACTMLMDERRLLACFTLAVAAQTPKSSPSKAWPARMRARARSSKLSSTTMAINAAPARRARSRPPPPTSSKPKSAAAMKSGSRD
jgi:hypothetical protein